jgi:hypothetical protein
VATESGYRRLVPDASPLATLRAARGATVGAAALAAWLAAQGESIRELLFTAGAIGAVLAVPMVVGLAGWSRSGRAAVAAIAVQIAVLAVLDWMLGVPGAFLWMLAAGAGTFAAVALLEPRLASDPAQGEAGEGLEGV